MRTLTAALTGAVLLASTTLVPMAQAAPVDLGLVADQDRALQALDSMDLTPMPDELADGLRGEAFYWLLDGRMIAGIVYAGIIKPAWQKSLPLRLCWSYCQFPGVVNIGGKWYFNVDKNTFYQYY